MLWLVGEGKALQNAVLRFINLNFAQETTKPGSSGVDENDGAFLFVTLSEFVGRPSLKYLNRIEYRYTAVVVRKQ